MSGTKIFTEAEIEAMARRLKGDIKDPTGIYTRAREKLIEIQAWTTPKMRRQLHKLLKQHRTSKVDEPAKPNDEKSFDEFRQEVGY